MNSSVHTRQSYDDKFIRSQSDSFVLLTTWKQVISSCKVYSISMMRTLTWEGIEFGNFILIASIHLWDQSSENFMSSSPSGCDFVTSLMTSRKHPAPEMRMALETLIEMTKHHSKRKQTLDSPHILRDSTIRDWKSEVLAVNHFERPITEEILYSFQKIDRWIRAGGTGPTTPTLVGPKIL